MQVNFATLAGLCTRRSTKLVDVAEILPTRLWSRYGVYAVYAMTPVEHGSKELGTHAAHGLARWPPPVA